MVSKMKYPGYFLLTYFVYGCNMIVESNREFSNMKKGDEYMYKFFANRRIVELMNVKNVNATKLAELTGWNPTKISRIINDQRELTSSEIQELIEIFNISGNDFFEEKYVMADKDRDESLTENLAKAGKIFASNERGEFQGSEVGNMFRKIIPGVIACKTSIDARDYKIEGSIGQGQFAEVPWISIFDRSITESATRGVYIVFLYSTDGKRVYLSLNQGYTYFSEKFSSKEARKEAIKMAEVLRRLINVSNSRAIDTIDLGAKKPLGRGYEATHIIGMEYDLDNMPSDGEVVRDFYELLSAYNTIKILFANREVNQFYDFLVAENNGLINLQTVEEGVNTCQVLDILDGKDDMDDIDIIVNDEPKLKQDAVIDDKGRRRFPRDSKVAANALIQGRYLCAFDESHKSFTAKGTNHMYVEAHHLIPLRESDRFVNSLDVEANVLSMCSTCHDAIHHATDEEKYVIIKRLYEIRKPRLEKAGIYTSLEQLLGFYNVNLEVMNKDL